LAYFASSSSSTDGGSGGGGQWRTFGRLKLPHIKLKGGTNVKTGLVFDRAQVEVTNHDHWDAFVVASFNQEQVKLRFKNKNGVSVKVGGWLSFLNLQYDGLSISKVDRVLGMNGLPGITVNEKDMETSICVSFVLSSTIFGDFILSFFSDQSPSSSFFRFSTTTHFQLLILVLMGWIPSPFNGRSSRWSGVITSLFVKLKFGNVSKKKKKKMIQSHKLKNKSLIN
jgi:hypothetical protein